MGYPLDSRQVFTTVLFLDKILKFSKIVILEFSDSLRPKFWWFFCPEKQSVGQREQNIFQMTALLQNATEILYKMGQTFFTKWARSFTKYDSYYKLRRFYYKTRQLLQNTTFITNCDSTFNQVLQSLLLNSSLFLDDN